MTTPLEAELHQQLFRLLTGAVSFDAFWEWLMPLQYTRDDPGPGKRLLYRIIGRLDEYENGDWTDEQLYKHLLGLLPAELRETVEQQRERARAQGPALPGTT